MRLLKAIVPIVMTTVLALTGCSSNSGKEERVLNIYSWADNFNMDVIKDFEQKFDAKVNYAIFSSNEDMLAKVQAGGAQFDLIQPSDYMVDTMIKLNLLEELDKSAIPNLQNLVSTFKTPPYDPDNKYSVVYTWGVTGIAYNKKYVTEPPTSWSDLWDPKYKGRVVVLNDSREALGMSLKKNGFSNSTISEKELDIANADLKKLLPNLLAFDTDTIKQKFIAEEAWIGTVWSGDAAFIYPENNNIGYVVPKEGGTIFADTFAIPKGAKHKKLAEEFINYMMDPAVSVKNYEKIGYSNPNEKAHPLHSEEYRNNKMIFLSPEEMSRTEWLKDVGETLQVYDRLWTELKSGR
ncbi:ABC transporter substrate-binding protein [Brevibacillus laterosporus]|uniref:ABC transporter substrate-binding protein n=1 Tax=Brevibacillus laterosporus TaxID=1465 RepID=UPI002654BE6F|nr:spermidine/putrescine ABC transporter substrate-binding protein [Brevibacillus laterosporus]MDN9009274.1 spermidine/putrescine ABC transporter substrate-binding protein [Brevibacillus laterosporus]MDO0940043.1 spermidine/putrescine ABC transporter substrate-binding protein [Brevibacillus laterosporus]